MSSSLSILKKPVSPSRAWLALGVFSALSFLGAHAAWAQSPAPTPAPSAPTAAPAGSAPGFLDKLRMKVDQLTPQKQSTVSTAVGGVRGSAVAAADVYWKGEAKPQVIDAAELEAFQKGLTLVDADQKAEARAVFVEFAKTYPESILKADAEEIVRHLAQ
jgi:TolA-binding protein